MMELLSKIKQYPNMYNLQPPDVKWFIDYYTVYCYNEVEGYDNHSIPPPPNVGLRDLVLVSY